MLNKIEDPIDYINELTKVYNEPYFIGKKKSIKDVQEIEWKVIYIKFQKRNP